MANSTLTGLLIIVLMVDALGFMGQQAMAETGLTNGSTIIGDAGILERVNGGNYTVNNTDPSNYLPGTTPGISTTGNIISDTYNDLRNWFTKTSTAIGNGWDILISLLAGPYPYIASMGLPQSFSFVIGALWFILTITLIVAFIAGRTWM